MAGKSRRIHSDKPVPEKHFLELHDFLLSDRLGLADVPRVFWHRIVQNSEATKILSLKVGWLRTERPTSTGKLTPSMEPTLMQARGLSSRGEIMIREGITGAVNHQD